MKITLQLHHLIRIVLGFNVSSLLEQKLTVQWERFFYNVCRVRYGIVQQTKENFLIVLSSFEVDSAKKKKAQAYSLHFRVI
jgi:hypothetical protein